MFWGLSFFAATRQIRPPCGNVFCLFNGFLSAEVSVGPPVFACTNNEATPWLMRSQALQRPKGMKMPGLGKPAGDLSTLEDYIALEGLKAVVAESKQTIKA
jgi:hypothetical protein